MTANGKITTANLIPGETRILIVRESEATAKLMERDAEMIPARKQTGAIVARVLEVRAGTRRRYETNVPREVVTTAGVVRAYGHQTFMLAPESAAAVKKAHVEALAMDAEFEAAKQEQADAEKVERREAFENRAETVPAVGDMLRCIPVLHTFGTVIEVRGDLVDVAICDRRGEKIGNDWSVTRKEFRDSWEIITSETWHSRAMRCPNAWHRTAAARMRQLCPECPVE